MIVEIVTTGTELLLGQDVNTNSAYLANQLNKLGFDVLYHSGGFQLLFAIRCAWTLSMSHSSV